MYFIVAKVDLLLACQLKTAVTYLHTLALLRRKSGLNLRVQ